MSKDNILPGDYGVLASIYDTVGMANFASTITPKLIDYAQRIDWLGRRIVVLGCGTGGDIEYLAQYPYTITGVDNSPDMLDVAKRKLAASGGSIKWLQLDIRDTGNQILQSDMVLALNVMNELNSLRDLESVFVTAQRILESGKLFIFDMRTLQGLAEATVNAEHLLYDSADALSVFNTSEYDYERQLQTLRYIIFRQANGGWQRSEARLLLRAFPVQAVSSLLQRNGFQIKTILNSKLEGYDPAVSHSDRVVFVAEKQSA
ncbi:MAG: class I SAM-dependent methyltransferase [Chloroflexi bacterium]|nr:class I SAM-dependent methyltransferase [Chloroflexota bacterium]MCC6896452.1 class I SAM-dependent methyltransferase [Anaerolineae bacterium]